ncbi:hypothetical protein [uncultured Marinobacter sp.]|uniref:hypothetical protein n=1 Tax=uncultured Marinobacter sp. TaxID=187379 RepID=UPI0025994A6D|nr:hypothetical protein [uncultured Marinobacter sp.]
MSDREEFEERNPVPDSATWNEKKQGYYWSNYPAVAHLFNDKWEVWHEAVEYVRAQSGQGAEPVAKIVSGYSGDPDTWNDLEIKPLDLSGCKVNDLLYTQPHPAQQGSVPDVGAMAAAKGAVEFAEDEQMVRDCPGVAAETIKELANLILSTTPQPEADGWVKCSERLPTEADGDWDGQVIVLDDHGEMACTNWSVATRKIITHWKPTGLKRPQPPKESA